MNKKYRIIAAALALVTALSCLACSSVFGAAAEPDYISAQLPGFESLSAVQIALTWRENLQRVRSTSAVHPDASAKSLEVTLASPADGEEYESFSFASVTAADKTIDSFENNAHELPRNGSVFGGVTLSDAEKISVWLGDYPAGGKVVMKLLAAPSRGPITDDEAFADYPLGFVYRSEEATPVDGVATFDISGFRADNDWTVGSIYDHINEINALMLTLIPGEGNAASGTKFYISDIRVWKKAADYSWSADIGAASGEFVFTVRSASAGVDISATVEGEPVVPVGGSYLNAYGETCVDFAVDTVAYPDGVKTLKAFDGAECVLTADVIFDNVEPFVNRIAETPNYGVSVSDGGGSIKMSAYADPGASYSFYKTDVLPVTAVENMSTLNDMKQRDPQGETAIDVSGVGHSTVSNTTSIPYQAFEIDASGKTNTVYINYKGSTVKNEALQFEGYNPTEQTWDVIARGNTSGAENEFSLALSPQDYADANGKIKVRVSEYLYGNGADAFAWTTDTQYYISTQSYRHFMVEQFNWFVSEYNDGNIAYVCNTGDVVNTKTSVSEYQLGRSIHNILDEADVPNGVTPGNHDIGNANDQTLYYDNWNTYFGSQYYDYQPWWGGGYLSNTSHYDLLTIGGHDFVFLYLGLNHETTDEGAAWANKVLKMYSHRTAVILTHQFLSTRGKLLTGNDGFADKIIEKIIEPNTNVRLVLCGHEPASHNLYHKMNNGVTVLELLHNYQFDYKLENGVWATTWSTTDGGAGYFRYMDVGENTITSRCYSASYPDVNHYYPEEAGIAENYTMDIVYVPSDRRINTSYFSATCGAEELGAPEVSSNGDVWTLSFNGEADGASGWYAVAEINGRFIRSAVYPIIEKPFDEPVLKGDLDGDGVITVSDALMTLRIAARLVAETPEAVAIADMDGDSEITVADALTVLRISVGLL